MRVIEESGEGTCLVDGGCLKQAALLEKEVGFFLEKILCKDICRGRIRRGLMGE